MASAILGRDTTTGELVTLSEESRSQGLYLIGLTRMGKSTLLENLIAQDMQAGLGLCLLDPHGTLVDAVLQHVPPEREQDVYLLDPEGEEYPFGLNIYECPSPVTDTSASDTEQQATQVFKKLSTDPDSGLPAWGALLEDLLGNVGFTLSRHPGALVNGEYLPYTMAEIPMLLRDDPSFRKQLLAHPDLQENWDVLDYWQEEFNPQTPRERRDNRASTGRRLRRFLRNPRVRNIVGQSHTTLRLGDIIDKNQILLVRLPSRQIGPDVVSLLGTFLVYLIYRATLNRAVGATPFHFYADEYWRFASDDFAHMFFEPGKFGVFTTVAHQGLYQLHTEVNQQNVLGIRNKVVFAISGVDAQAFAKEGFELPRQERVVGYRPKRVIPTKPVAELLRNPAEDKSLRDFTTKYLDKLDRWVRERVNENTSSKYQTFTNTGNTPYWYSHDNAIRAVDKLNVYLHGLMQQTFTPHSTTGVKQLITITHLLCGYIGFLNEINWHSYGERQEETYDALLSHDFQAVLRTYIEQIANDPDQPAEDLFRRMVLIHRRDNHRDSTLELDWIAPLVGPECARLTAFLRELLSVAQKLATAPISVPSSESEPIYEERPIADLQNELALTLNGQPRWHAYCQIDEGGRRVSHIIETLPPPQPPSDDVVAQRRSRIIAQTRLTLCRPRQEVIAEIVARQGRYVGETEVELPPPPDGPRPQLRTPREEDL